MPICRPDKTQIFRWSKRLGHPTSLTEFISQHTWLLIPYIAIVVSLILFFQLKGN